MLGKLLGKNKPKTSDDAEIQKIKEKISKMGLTELRVYLKNKSESFEVCGDGLSELMKKLNTVDEKTSKKFIEDDAMDSKKKKAFELVIMAASHKKITISVAELIQEFTEIYKEMILKFDVDNQEIYKSKLKKALGSALNNLAIKSELSKKMKIIGR